MSEQIPGAWAMKIASVLKDNYTMADILSLTNSFGATNDIDIKYSQAPKMMNKQNVAQQNLSMFSVSQVIQFLTDIVESGTGIMPEELSDLLQETIEKFPNEANLQDTKTIEKIKEKFSEYEGVPEAWSKAQRNLAMKHFRESVDNGRLAMELFFKAIFQNNKSLENQKPNIGSFLSEQPKEFRELIMSQISSYERLQNQQFKHNLPDNLREDEIRYILNTTYLIMDYMERKSHD